MKVAISLWLMAISLTTYGGWTKAVVDSGRKLPNGIYFCQLKSEKNIISKKFILIR